MDVFQGDLYAHDPDTGCLDKEEAIALPTSLYQQFLFINKVHGTRVIIGGKGRRNESNADRLALAILETSRRVKDAVPQLTLRYFMQVEIMAYHSTGRRKWESLGIPYRLESLE